MYIYILTNHLWSRYSMAKVELTVIIHHLKAILCLVGCVWSVGLFRTVNATNMIAKKDQSPQPLSDIITFHHGRHLFVAENDSSTKLPILLSSSSVKVNTQQQSHRVRRLSIWRNPLSASKLRHRLVAIGRPITSRESKSPSAYTRLSQFVRNHLHNFNVSFAQNGKSHHKGRSIDIEKRQLIVTNETNSLNISKNSEKMFTNSTTNNGDPKDRLIARHDDTLLNQIDTDIATVNVSSKSADQTNMPYLSPSLNVIDLEPYNTKIAHNILIVRKPGTSFNNINNSIQNLPVITLSTPGPVIISSEIKNVNSNQNLPTNISTNSINAAVKIKSSSSIRDDSILEFVSIKNNHRPSTFVSLAKWKLKNKDKLINTSTTEVKIETSTPAAAISNALPWKRPQQQQVVSSNHHTVNPDLNVITTLVTTRKLPTYSPKPTTMSIISWSSSSTSPLSTTSITTVASASASMPTESVSSIKLFSVNSNISSSSNSSGNKLSEVNKFNHTLTNSQSELITNLTTVSAMNEEDFWSSFATENPMTTMFTTGSVTEFDLPITQFSSTDSNKGTQSWEKTNNSAHNSEGAQLTTGEKKTAWSGAIITSKPLGVNSTNNTASSATKTWTGPTSGKEDDNSIELLNEYQENKQSLQTSISTGTHSLPIENKVDSEVNFYHNNGHQQYHEQKHQQMKHNVQKNSMDDGVVIFKNNHNRPKRPLRPLSTTNKYMQVTGKPPYITDFLYPTTISVKKPTITVANIVAHRVKQPDEVQSASLTVLDPPFVPDSFMQLPLNTTIVHKNILVPMRDGRPKPSYPSRPTTHFPVYPVVAGVSNWQSQTTPWILPVMTTSSPDKLDGLMSSTQDKTNFSVTEEEFKWYTSTTVPSKTISKVISVFPNKSYTVTSSIDRVGTTSKMATTTTTINPLLHATSSSTIRPASYPVATSSGYVNAIYAPPMPVFRPAHSLESGQAVSNWFLQPLNKLLNLIAPNQAGSVSFMSVIRSVLYTLMVMLLPPLALMSAFSLV